MLIIMNTNRIILTTMVVVLSYFTIYVHGWTSASASATKSVGSNSGDGKELHSFLSGSSVGDSFGHYAKRQLVPLPRIGRSFYSSPPAVNKRQSIIPAPRIGRSSASTSQSDISSTSDKEDTDNSQTKSISTKSVRSIDCSVNAELCENVDSAGGFGGNNDDLVEPIDIQLRAAFIPRLGKRRSPAQSSSSVMYGTEANSDSGQRFRRRMIMIPGIGRQYYVVPPYGSNSGDETGTSKANSWDQLSYSMDSGDLGGTSNINNNNNNEDSDENSASNANMLTEQPMSSHTRALLLRTLWDNNKRAIPYTPRIGRAVFAPRIGKKATFVPRIG